MPINNIIENYHEKSVDEKRRIVDALCDSFDTDREACCIGCPYEGKFDSWCRCGDTPDIPDELLDSVIESLANGLKEAKKIPAKRMVTLELTEEEAECLAIVCSIAIEHFKNHKGFNENYMNERLKQSRELYQKVDTAIREYKATQ